MPYISRNSEGEIIALHQSPPTEDSMWVEIGEPEVVKFLQQIETLDQAKLILTNTDYEMVRVIEDLVDLLIDKQLFTFTELPEAVQQKLGARKNLRKEMQVLGNLIDDDIKII